MVSIYHCGYCAFVRFKGHARITPRAKAKGLVIKGTVVLLVKAKANKKGVVSAARLIGGKSFKLGGQEVRLRNNGSGSQMGDKFASYRLKTALKIQKMTVTGEDPKKRLIKFQIGRAGESARVDVFIDNLRPTHSIVVEYAIPESEAVNIDVKIGPGFGFVSI